VVCMGTRVRRRHVYQVDTYFHLRYFDVYFIGTECGVVSICYA